MPDQQKRVAIVTGASAGIGAAMAHRLAADGLAVVVNYAHGRDAAEAIVRAIEAAGGEAVAVQADIGAADGVRRLFDAAEQAFGGTDVLVNNAAGMQFGPVADTSDEDFERLLMLNVTGSFRGMREAAKRLRDGGRIVNFSSSVVGLYQPGYGPYAATKAAVEALTHVLAKELAPRGITVNAIAPGPVETRLFLQGKSEELVQTITRMIPAGRLGQPDDIAGLASFLAGADSRWVTGQVIRANGGMI